MSINTTDNRLKYNIIYNILYQILSILVPLVTAPYISRVLGKDGMGIYGFAYSISHYFVLFCMLGILNYGNREISIISNDINKRTAKFAQIYIIQFISGIISLLVYILFVFFFIKDNQIIFYLQTLYIISGILDISWFYFGIEKFKITTVISALNKIFTTLLIFVFVKSYNDVWIYTLILAGGTLFNNVLYWSFLKRFISNISIDFNKIKQHIKPLLLLFIPVIAISVYKYIDKVMLGVMLDIGEVGIFEAAEKLTNIPIGVISAIGTVMLPRISNMLNKEEDKSKVIKYNIISLELVMFLSIGMTFGLAGISDVFVPLFYGNDFLNSYKVLLFLLPCLVFVSWANVIRTQYLLPNKKDTIFCLSVIIGAIVNVISNFILIPYFGAVGAAISTIIAEFTVCVYQSIVANKELNLTKSLVFSLRFILIGIIMYIVIVNININSSIVCVVVRILSGIIIYILLSLFYLRNYIPIK